MERIRHAPVIGLLFFKRSAEFDTTPKRPARYRVFRRRYSTVTKILIVVIVSVIAHPKVGCLCHYNSWNSVTLRQQALQLGKIPTSPNGPLHVRVVKRVVDIPFALAISPMIGVLAVALLVLNPIFNPGPVFFRHERMGQVRVPFRIWKIRTMAPCIGVKLNHDDPIEGDRINRFGEILPKTRLDEPPRFINVLRGEMSLIGPRSDMISQALTFSATIPRYHEQFRVKPGITGLAQVRYGYADRERTVRRQAKNDFMYVER